MSASYDGLFVISCPRPGQNGQTQAEYFVMRRGGKPGSIPEVVGAPHKTADDAFRALRREREAPATQLLTGRRGGALAGALFVLWLCSGALFVVLWLCAPVAVAFDAGIPGTPRAEIRGAGVLEGWTVTLYGTAMCDELDVIPARREIACWIEGGE